MVGHNTVGTVYLKEDGADPILRDMAMHAVWADLSQHRSGYAGLHTGID